MTPPPTFGPVGGGTHLAGYVVKHRSAGLSVAMSARGTSPIAH